MSTPISLYKRRIEKLNKVIDDTVEEADKKFDFIDDELIDFAIQKGDVNLNSAVKTIWSLAKKMDQIEHEIVKLKLIMLAARRNDNNIEKGGG